MWVMKPQCHTGVGGPTLLRELAGAELCARVGLKTPAIGLLRVPNDPPATDDTEAGRAAAKIYNKDRGKLAFCSRFIWAPPADPVRLGRLSKGSTPMARDGITLFALDTLIWNYDRNIGNPNALSHRRRVLPIDHDHAFFDMDAVDDSGASKVSYSAFPERPRIARHISAKLARKHWDSLAWKEFEECFCAITDEEIKAMAERWPDELDRNFHGGPVGWKANFVQFLCRRRDNVVHVLQELRRVNA
jgi:hypothetical protein